MILSDKQCFVRTVTIEGNNKFDFWSDPARAIEVIDYKPLPIKSDKYSYCWTAIFNNLKIDYGWLRKEDKFGDTKAEIFKIYTNDTK